MPDPKGKLVTPVAFTVGGKVVALLSDDAGHLQIDIIATALSPLAATAAKQLADDHNVKVTALPAGLATSAKQLADGHNVVATATNLDIRDLVHTQDAVVIYGKDDGGTARVLLTDEDGRLQTGGGVETTAKARAYLAGAQTITTGTDTKLLVDTASYDPSDIFDSGNNKMVIKVAGYYQIIYMAAFIAADVVAYRWIQSAIKVDGAYVSLTSLHTATTKEISVSGNDILHLDLGDELEIWIYHEFGVNGRLNSTEAATYLAVHLLSVD